MSEPWKPTPEDVFAWLEHVERTSLSGRTTVLARLALDLARKGAEAPDHISTLALCEQGKLILRPGLTYRFEPIEGCEACAKLLAEGRVEVPHVPSHHRAGAMERDLTLTGHECETVLDLGRHMLDGSEVGGHSRIWRLGRLLTPIEGAPAELWCLHIRTAWKPEIVFGFNEADMQYLAVTAYAALGYHVNHDWIEAIAGLTQDDVGPEVGDG